MKVLQLSAVPFGGAGLACLRLHHALLDAGCDSKMLTLIGPEENGKGIFSFESSDPAFAKKMARAKRKRYFENWKVRLHGKTQELFSFNDSLWKIEEHPLVKEADIIHLHWVAGMIDITGFFRDVKKPVVWTLHDAWPYTGGFHYEKYWDSVKFAALTKKGLEIRKRAYRGQSLSVVAPSKYLLDQCVESGVFDTASFHHIPNSVPSDIFHLSADRDAVRSQYKIRPEELMWVFGSDELNYFRKGADILLDAFAQWKTPHVRLVIAGKGELQNRVADPRISFTGHINDQHTMARLLGAADALIHPSREDNMPNVIVESFFCGTPVLATPAGGVPEMITAANGLLTGDFSPESLRRSFDVLLKTQFNRENISQEAQEKYASALQAKKIIEVYKSLC